MTGAKKPAKFGRYFAVKGLVLQLVISVVGVSLATLLFDPNVGVAVAFGTAISLIPNAIFAYFAFKATGASRLHEIHRNFGLGSKLKLVATVCLFTVAFFGLSMSPLPVFAGFFIATVANWTALIRLKAH